MEIFIGFYAAIIILCITFFVSSFVSWIIQKKTDKRKKEVLDICYSRGFMCGKTGESVAGEMVDLEFYPYTQNAFLRGYFDGKDAKEKGVK